MRGGEYDHEVPTCERASAVPMTKQQHSTRTAQCYNGRERAYAGDSPHMVPQSHPATPPGTPRESSYSAVHGKAPQPTGPYPPPRHPPAAFMQGGRQLPGQGKATISESSRPPHYVRVPRLPSRESNVFRQHNQQPTMLSPNRMTSAYLENDHHVRPVGSSRNIERCATYPPPITNRPKRKMDSAAMNNDQFLRERSRSRDGAIYMTQSMDSDAHAKRPRLHNHKRIDSCPHGQSWTGDHDVGPHHQAGRRFDGNNKYDCPSMSWGGYSQDGNNLNHKEGNGHPPPPYSITSRIVSWEGGQPPPSHESQNDTRLRAEFEPPQSPRLRRMDVYERVIHARHIPEESTVYQHTAQAVVNRPRGNQVVGSTPTAQDCWHPSSAPRHHCHEETQMNQTQAIYGPSKNSGYDNDKCYSSARNSGNERYGGFHERVHSHNDAYNISQRPDHTPNTSHFHNASYHKWSNTSDERQHGHILSGKDVVEGRTLSASQLMGPSWRPSVSPQQERSHHPVTRTHWVEERQVETVMQNPSFTDTRDDVQTHEGVSAATQGPVSAIYRDTYPNHSEQRDGISNEDDGMKPFVVSHDQLRTKSGILLLAQPQDRISLSETLSMIRENIEVFTATPADVDAPAPGRKRPVVVDQVGLRCIHCRDSIHQGERVKRAVCFPSSIKRIYRTVIDMKLDHFQSCKFVPSRLKERLDELKAINTRSTGTTMHYFVQAAKRMGMVDGPHGVRMVGDQQEVHQDQHALQAQKNGLHDTADNASKPDSASLSSKTESEETTRSDDKSCTLTSIKVLPRNRSESFATNEINPVASTLSMDTSTEDDMCNKNDTEDINKNTEAKESNKAVMSNSSSDNTAPSADSQTTYTGKVLLALEDDKTALSPLRCFLRENVYAFSATNEDIAVRTPTTFSVALGQVGIGCIHCHSLPAKERSNRAVCFPFSIGRIYQSVADIQRFHLGECKMVPDYVKAKFASLQSASSKGSKGLATRQYWVASAKKLGLVDTLNGIRFSRDPAAPIAPAISLDILAQVASDVTTASRPLVLPEDKETIAEFLYVVMEQLQPCRFTEADRNKRRLKDVGCIGVECKHCAGHVESRKFFWSSVNAVESNFVSVHTHMMECRMIPDETKNRLAQLKKLRKEQTSSLKTGSQKAFFARVWQRLHDDGNGLPPSPQTNHASQKHTDKWNVQNVRNKMDEMSVVAV